MKKLGCYFQPGEIKIKPCHKSVVKLTALTIGQDLNQVQNDVARVFREHLQRRQDLEETTLPEGEEKDGLNGDELVEGIEGGEALLGGLVEEDEEVEGQGDGDVVHEREPGEAAVQVVRPVAEHVVLVEHDGQHRGDWLDKHELKHALLDPSEEHPVLGNSQQTIKEGRYLLVSLERA